MNEPPFSDRANHDGQLAAVRSFKHCRTWNLSADPEMIPTTEDNLAQARSEASAMCQRALLEWRLRFTPKSKKTAMRFEHIEGNLSLNQDRYGVCIHEAAQTAVAFRVYHYEGRPECGVTDNSSGYIKLDFSAVDATPRDRAVVALSGPVAEFKWGAGDENFYVWCAKNRERASRRLDGDSDLADDMSLALDEARKAEVVQEQQLELFERWTVEAGTLISEMWDEIIEISNHLYDSGYMPGKSQFRA